MSMAASQSSRPSDGGAIQPVYKGLDMATRLVDRGLTPDYWSAKFGPRLFFKICLHSFVLAECL